MSLAIRYASQDETKLLAHLREHDLVCEGVLEELVAMQRAAHKPFGRIAVELGFMRIVQVAKVLSHQATRPQCNFGDIARALGFLRSEQITQIVQRQKEIVPSLAQLLVSEMLLEPSELNEILYSVQAGMPLSLIHI